jgi:hypothetical protein
MVYAIHLSCFSSVDDSLLCPRKSVNIALNTNEHDLLESKNESRNPSLARPMEKV